MKERFPSDRRPAWRQRFLAHPEESYSPELMQLGRDGDLDMTNLVEVG